MDPNAKCQDTSSSKQKKEAKAFTFYRLETEEISERYIAPCFVNRLEAYDGEINLEQDKKLISNEFAVKLCLEHKVKNRDKVVKKELIVALRGEIYFVKFILNPKEDDIEPGVILERSFMRLTKGIADFGNGVITIYLELDPFLDNSNEIEKSEDDWELILNGIDFGDIPELEETSLSLFVCNMGKGARNKKMPFENYQMNYSDEGPSLTNKQPLTQEEADREAIAVDIYKRFSILKEARPIIKTLAYIDKYKKILDSIFLDKLKLDGEIKSEEEEAIKKVMGEALKEKDDPGAFVIPIRLDAKINLNALSNTGSDINIMLFRIYAKLGKDEVKPVNRGITMLNHSKAEPMGLLKDLLCQVGVTTITAKFFILYMHVDKEVPILVKRGILNTCSSILDIIERTMSTFDGICQQKFRAAKTNMTTEESDNKDDEDY
ncbi:hypothetical protein Tco_0335889 [Tanacetum coccineum]